MIPYSEPERSEMIDMRKLKMDQLWRQKKVGDLTYIRSPTFYRYSVSDAITELNLLKMEI